MEESSDLLRFHSHWSVGDILHSYVVVINIFFGLEFDRSDRISPDWLIWIMVAYVAVHVLAEVLLELNKCISANTARNRE